MLIHPARQEPAVPAPQIATPDSEAPPDATIADGEVIISTQTSSGVTGSSVSASLSTATSPTPPASTTSSEFRELSTEMTFPQETTTLSTTLSTTEVASSNIPSILEVTPLVVSAPSEAVSTTAQLSETISELATTSTTPNDGTETNFPSTKPTTLVGEANPTSGPSRTPLIAGLTSGLIVLLIMLLLAAFSFRRHRRKREQNALIADMKRKEGRGLLDGEGFSDDPKHIGSLAVQTSTPHVRPYSQSLSPILHTRCSETGSIFRENVWPPPSEEMVDPVLHRSSQVDLSRVVQDVMGPHSHHQHTRSGTDNSIDSSTPLMSTLLSNPFSVGTGMDSTHSRGPSLNSMYMDHYSMPSLRTSSPSSYPSFSHGLANSASSIPQEAVVVMAPMTTSPTSPQASLPHAQDISHIEPFVASSPPDSGRGNSIPRMSSPLARRLSFEGREAKGHTTL